MLISLQEEQEYVELLAAEKHQQEAVKNALTRNKTLSILDEILEDVRKAADRLEEEIEEHAFDNNKQVCKKKKSPYCGYSNTDDNRDCAALHTPCCAAERSERRGCAESGRG